MPQDMEQQLSDARTRIIQLKAEVQSTKQSSEQHEHTADRLQAQVLTATTYASADLQQRPAVSHATA